MTEKESELFVDTIVKQASLVKVKCYKCNTKLEFEKVSIPDNCPNCNYTEWWYKPEKERNLFILQKRFLDSNKNPKFLADMYQPLYEYVRIAILKKIKNKKILSKDDLEIKVEDTVSKIFIYLSDEKKYPGWKIEDSWYGVISMVLLDTLYNRKKVFNEHINSLNSVVNSEKSNKLELQDVVTSFGYRTLYNEEVNTEKAVLSKNAGIVKQVVSLIQSIIEKLQFSKGDRIAMLVLIGLKYVLDNKKQDFMQTYYDYVGYEIEQLIKKFTEVIQDYIKMESENY